MSEYIDKAIINHQKRGKMIKSYKVKKKELEEIFKDMNYQLEIKIGGMR